MSGVVRHVRGCSHLRRDDVLLTSYPRSGNSWFRMVLVGLVYEGGTQDLRDLPELMPSLGISDLRPRWEVGELPRFVKTHHRRRPMLFARPRNAVLLLRDPRDASRSYHEMLAHSTRAPYRGSLSEFLRDGQRGLPAWFRHYASWARFATVVTRYEDLRSDEEAEFRRVLRAVGADIDIERLRTALKAASIDRVRTIEQGTGLAGERFTGEYRVVGSGKCEQWREVFSAADRAFYADLWQRAQVEGYPPD